MNNSIANRLLRVVFSIYLSITCVIPLVQLYNEYSMEKQDVVDNLDIYEANFSQGLARALWMYDNDQATAILDGIVKLSGVAGVRITDADDKLLLARMLENGQVVDKDILPEENHASHFGLFQKKFPVQFDGNNVASVNFFSSEKIVFDGVKYSFLIILINAVIKTMLLWWLFVWAFNRYLVYSLNHFVLQMEHLGKDEEDLKPVALTTFDTHELIRLESVFNRMIYRILKKQNTIRQLNKNLESKVEERTVELKKNNMQLCLNRDLLDNHVLSTHSDLDGNVLDLSIALLKLTGYEKNEVVGLPHRIFGCSENNPEIYKDLWLTLTRDEVWYGEFLNQKKNGERYWVDITIQPKFDEHGIKVGYLSVQHNITAQKHIEKVSITDALTGLYNRRHFNIMIERELRRARREKENMTFMLLDVDRFKEYNDFYGHQAGDEVLVKVAKVLLESCTRAVDFVFRVGGEEFFILTSKLSEAESQAFAKEILNAISALTIPHVRNSASDVVSASLGLITLKVGESDTVDKIYKLTDERLYCAKQTGRNKICAD